MTAPCHQGWSSAARALTLMADFGAAGFGLTQPLVHASTQPRKERRMSYSAEEQANLDLVAGLFREVLNPMDSGAVDRFIDAGYIQHSQMAPPGRDALKAFLDMI